MVEEDVMFVLKHVSSGWIIELCLPVEKRNDPTSERVYCYTASLRWRTKPEHVQTQYMHDDYAEAKKACDEKNGITRK